MLMGKVLERLGKSHGGKSALQKGQMIAPAQEAVSPGDQAHGHARLVALAGFFEVAAQLAGGRVVVATGTGDDFQ